MSMSMTNSVAPAPAIPNWMTKIEALDEAGLLTRREELTRKGRGDGRSVPPVQLSIEETEELCAIYNRLRMGKGGPPSGKRKPSRKLVVVDALDDI